MTPERKLVGVVAVDPAYSGPCGITVRRFERDVDVAHVVALSVRSPKLFRWLGDVVCANCGAGEQLAFVVESDAFGGHAVARKLGIGIGIIEGTLVDMQAVEAETRIDVATQTWRTVLGRMPKGRGLPKSPAARRKALKQAAIDWARETFGFELTADAAESLAISEWFRATHYDKG